MNAFESTPTKRRKVDMGTSSSVASPVSIGTSANNAIVLYEPNLASDKSSPASMDELVRSTPVVLSIGPDQEQTSVQAILFRGISEPLHRMLQAALNGQDNANKLNECLRHDDKGAFLHLISLAYNIVLKSGVYPAASVVTTEGAISSKNPTEDDPNTCVQLLKCQRCKKNNIYLTTECESGQTCASKIGLDKFFALQLQHSHGAASKQAGLRSKNTPTVLDVKDKVSGKPYTLIHFAKVFSLARKYNVYALKINALKAFERRLKKYAETESSDNEELLEALKYLAHNARIDVGDELNNDGHHPGLRISTSTLLRSLMRYVIANITDLLEDEEFVEIVAENGNIGLEMMWILQESIVVSRGSQFD